MSRNLLLLGLAVCVLASGCRSVPGSGRKQLLLLPEDHETALGIATYRDVLKSEPLSQNPRYVELVNRVGRRIAAVAGRPDYQWEFNVIASAEQNAFALPGGKVAVYEGILPICENEAGLAVVMSHEIAHALARHGGERMSQEYVVDGVGTVVSHVTQTAEEKRRERVEQAYGIASEYGYVLPFSRKHESEADSIGLLLMAQAGYDPHEAPRFWQRFANAKDGPGVPEFFSTHPSDERRALELQNQLTTALQHYQSAPFKYGTGELLR